MNQQHLDTLIDALEDLYPGKFTELSSAESVLWRKELGDTSLETALAAVHRWYMNHLRQYIPTLTSLLTLIDEVEHDDRRELARQRTANAGWDAGGLPGVLKRAEDAFVAGARDDNTALYGRLMGILAQRSLGQRLSKDDLAAQCQIWAVQYPQIAGHLTAAARQFVPVGVM